MRRFWFVRGVLSPTVAMKGMLWTGNGGLAGEAYKGKGHQTVEGIRVSHLS